MIKGPRYLTQIRFVGGKGLGMHTVSIKLSVTSPAMQHFQELTMTENHFHTSPFLNSLLTKF